MDSSSASYQHYGAEAHSDGLGEETASKTSVISTLVSNVSAITFRDVYEVLITIVEVFVMAVPVEIWYYRYDWQRPFPYQVLEDGEVVVDLTLNYPEEESVVSELVLIMTCMVLPLLVVVIAGFLFGPRHDAKASGCAWLLGQGINYSATHALKIYCGFYRPNTNSMCDYDVDSGSCQNEDWEDARHSFPSGHASIAFCGMTLLSLYFWGKLGWHSQLDQPHPGLGRHVYMLAAGLPMVYAVFVAATRVHDFHHHPADVVAGSLIGYASMAFAYSLWYPSIYSAHAGKSLQLIREDAQLARSLSDRMNE